MIERGHPCLWFASILLALFSRRSEQGCSRPADKDVSAPVAGIPSRIHPLSPHDSHATSPIFIEIEAIDFNVRRYSARERRERWMKTQRRRYEIDQWRFIADLTFAKEPGAAEVAATSMRFDAAPVINSLEDMLAVFVDFQFDHRQPSVVTQRQQVDRPRSRWAAARGAKLRVERRDD